MKKEWKRKKERKRKKKGQCDLLGSQGEPIRSSGAHCIQKG